MRILVAGDWHSNIHETAVAEAFVQLGHEVVRFPWHNYFIRPKGLMGPWRHLWRRVQNKFVAGPQLARLNRDFVGLVKETRPDAVFVYRGTHISPTSLKAIRQAVPRCVLLGYNNDDPLGPGQPAWLWKYFLNALSLYDLVLAYRQHNIDDFLAAGAQRVELLRSWFIPQRNRPMALSQEEKEQYDCDVVFVGHYEPDHRVQCLEEVVRRGWRLRLFGPGYDWDPVIRANPLLKSQLPVRLVWGDDYNRAISGAKVALCFLSKLNRDTYTRRCFEIPAIGSVLLSEYTDDLASLYIPDGDACFFRDKNEMADKIEGLLGDDAWREQVARRGRSRVLVDGHDVMSRMIQVLAWIDEIRESKI